MSKIKIRFTLFILFFLLLFRANATHIVGAQLYYECLNASTNQYQLTLKFYRDCLNGQANFDDPITLFIFQGTSGALYQTVDIPVPFNTPQVQPTNWGPCVSVPPAVCVEEGIYQTTITLPPLAGGYNLGWARCCRNYAITNLNDPQVEGVTFLAHIPDPGLATCNSMPTFDNTPPFFFCQNQTFTFDYSATDPDGDSLVYFLTNPYTGTNFNGLGAGNPNFGGNNPVVSPGGNPMGPPPYQNVVFAAGYSFINPFGPGSTINLDSQTGLLTVTPAQLGIFVVAVSVFEYRNGVLLSENKQDLQIHVLNCLPQNAPPAINHDLSLLNHNGDTIFVNPTQSFCYPYTASAPLVIGTLQVTPVSNIFNTGATITFSGVNPVTGQVCWTPSCNNVNQLIPIIIKVHDTGNCPGFGTAFDTVWIKVILPPNNAPVITPDYTGLTMQSGTIIINATNQLCYNFTVADIEGDSIDINPTSPVFNSANPPVITITGSNPLTGQICWTPDCALSGQLIPITFTATDLSLCNVTHTVTSSVSVLVQIPPNNLPVLNTNLSGTVNSGDTIYTTALSNFCFSFTGSDTDIADSLTMIGVSPVFNAPNPPTFTVTGVNPISGQICWTPGCQYVGQTIQLIYKVKDTGVCNNIGEDYDTVYVNIAYPPNSAPVLNTNLAGNNFSNDTIYVFALNSLCFNFLANDVNAGDSLDFVPVSPVFSSPVNAPVVTLTGNNPLQGQICWTPDCNLDGQVIPFIYGIGDEGGCNNILYDYDTVYVNVTIPPNQAPLVTHDLTGTNFSNDTIYIAALSSFCYDFSVSDINTGDTLTVSTLSPVFNTPNPPSFTFSGVNPLQGQICWTPGCQYVGQAVAFVIEASDDAICNTDLQDKDTVWVFVEVPPNTAPASVHDFGSLVSVGDTIFGDALDTLCYTLTFNDLDLGDTLTVSFLSPIFTAVNPPVITQTGINPVNIEICWVPDCAYEGLLVPFVVQATDNGKCNNPLSVVDTVLIKINDPITIPPVVVHDLSGTTHIGDLILVYFTDSVCYDFYIADQTPDNGMDYTYEFYDAIIGTNLGLGSVTTTTVNDTIYGTVCFQPTCANGGSTYNVIITGIDKATCPPFDETKDTVQIKVMTDFYAIASNDTAFCYGTGGLTVSVVPFGGTPPYNYTWGCFNPNGCGISNPYIANPTVNPNESSTYWVQLQDGEGCTSEIDSVVVMVNPIPVVDAGPDTAICKGGPGCYLGGAVLNDSVCPPPYSYSWFPSVGLNNDTIPFPYATPSVTTIYGLVVTDANGCSSNVTTLDTLSTVTVTVKPIPIVEAGPDQHMCNLDTVQLLGYAYGAGPAYTYTWTPVSGVVDYTVASPLVSPASNTTYTLIAWSNGCPGVGDTATVFVHTMPTANPGITFDICYGDSAQLTGIAGGDSTATYTFSWSPASGLDNPAAAAPWASPDTTTTYSLVVNSNYGCISAPYDMTVTILPTPVADAGIGAMICETDSIQLSGSYTFVNGSTGNPVFTQWSFAQSLSDSMSSTPMAFPEQTTTYIFNATLGSCSTSDVVVIQVSPAFSVDASASQPGICERDTIQLFASGGLGNPVYSWTPDDFISNPGIANPYIYPDTPMTYILTIQEGLCSFSDSVFIDVKPKPTAGIANTYPVVCLENPVIYLYENASDALSYIWNFGDNSPVSNQPDVIHTYTQPGSYTVTLTVKSWGGCSDSAQVPVTVSAGPVAAFVSSPSYQDMIYLPNSGVQFNNQSLNGISYNWTMGDEGGSSEFNPHYFFQTPGVKIVTLTVTDEYGCRDTVSYRYEIFSPELFIPNAFTPNQDGFHDDFQIIYQGSEAFYASVYDRWGVKVFESVSPLNAWNGNVPSGKPASDGTYYYVVKVGDKIYNGAVTLMR